jgi:hypothetical protein
VSRAKNNIQQVKIIPECSLSSLVFKEGVQTVKLNTERLQPGMYVIEISSGNEMIYAKISINR